MTKQHRSPKYPFITLEKALTRAQQFYDSESKNSANIVVATKALGYSEKSSGGQQTIGALVGFGLLLDEGAGDSRRLKLSDLALRILLDKRPDSAERKELIREAALTPKIFRELWDEWREAGLPSDANMHHTLVFNWNFPDKGVPEFIKVFRGTLDFAKLSASEGGDEEKNGKNVGVLNGEDKAKSGEKVKQASVIMAANSSKRTGEAKVMKQDTLDLDEGVAVLQWPANISKESLAEIRGWLAYQLTRMESRANKSQAAAQDRTNEERSFEPEE